jgi:hypothetical protein
MPRYWDPTGRHDRWTGPDRRDRLVPGIGFVVDEVRGECLPSTVADHDLEFYSHSWCEHVRVAIEYRCMQKDILAAVVRRDKSITTRLVELQHPACYQFYHHRPVAVPAVLRASGP